MKEAVPMSRNHLALALALPALAAAVVASPAAAGSSLPKLLSCAGTPLLRPTGTVVLSCADANSELRSTHWLSWTASSATGRTDFGVNLCTPDCAASRIRFFADSTVRLEDPSSTAKGRLFTRAVITYKLNGKAKTFTAYLAD
jgi:hypothetical protein